MATAAHTKITPGSTSIDRVKPRERPDGSWVIDWSVRLMDGRLVEKRSQGKTKGEARARAKAKAEELLRTTSTTWKLSDDLSDYFDKVSKPTLAKAKLRDTTQRAYARAGDLLFGKCDQHTHTDSLRGHTIDSGTRVRALEACLQEISKFHGAETARQAQNVASKYMLGQLVRDDLLRANPLYGVKIDLKSDAKPPKTVKRGGQSPTRDEYDRLMTHLLDFDVKAAVPEKLQSRWTHAERASKLANTIDLTLLQMATGLRIREALTATWDDVTVDAAGVMHVTVDEERSKTHRARTVPILDARVTTRMLERRNASQSAVYVLGSPTDDTKPWDGTNARKAVAKLYQELATELDIPLLTTARTHVWRATLNTLLLDQVPEVTRAAFFGHTGDVNRSSYTDHTDVSAMVEAGKHLRAV